MVAKLTLDPGLADYATPRQKEYLSAVIEHGSARGAARAMNVHPNAVSGAMSALQREAARRGYAPGHWQAGVAPGYRMSKVTVQRANGVVERTWERQLPDAANLEAMVARCEERLKDFARFEALPPPDPAAGTLTNFLGLFDLHIGEKIASDDPYGRWDIQIAKRTIIGSATHAMRVAPKAKRLVICFGGDAMHYDGVVPVTPTSKHVLHSDGDFDDMVDATLDIALAVIDEGLRTHEEVHLVWATGNHDLSTSRMLRKMFGRLYEGEPRLKVVQSRLDYYAMQFGKVMLCIHHGHGAKLTDYAGIFASMFREMWGQTVYAYGHRGHEHHIHAKEKGGMVSLQHPSLAPSDDYALSKGLISRRGCIMTTYHDEYGEVGQNTTRPEMLEVAA